MKTASLVLLAALIVACSAKYIGVGGRGIMELDVDTGATKVIDYIETKPPPGTVTYYMVPSSGTYAAHANAFFTVYQTKNTGKYWIVKYDRKTKNSTSGPFVTYAIKNLYTHDDRLFGITAGLAIIEYDFNTLQQIAIRNDTSKEFVIVFDEIAFNEETHEVTVHTYSDGMTRFVTIDTKLFDVPDSKLIVRSVESEFNVDGLFVNPVEKGHLLGQWNWNQYSGTEVLLDMAVDGSVPRNVTVKPAADYRGTLSTVQVHAVNTKTAEYVMGLLETGRNRQFIVIIDIKSFTVKSVKQVPDELIQFKLYFLNE